LNPIVEWVQLTIEKILLKYPSVICRNKGILILILSNTRCGTSGL
jgi:hypothetical protein